MPVCVRVGVFVCVHAGLCFAILQSHIRQGHMHTGPHAYEEHRRQQTQKGTDNIVLVELIFQRMPLPVFVRGGGGKGGSRG